MYESLVLVDPEAAVTAGQLASELRRFYAGAQDAPEIVQSGETVSLQWSDYMLEVGESHAPHVLEESAEIAAERAAAHPDKERIARCACRFEISGPEDPDMDHFNDYLFVGEALARLGRVYRFEQASGEFLE
jgi:hypothetical protein